MNLINMSKNKHEPVFVSHLQPAVKHTYNPNTGREGTGLGLWSVFTLGAGEQVDYVASWSILDVFYTL